MSILRMQAGVGGRDNLLGSNKPLQLPRLQTPALLWVIWVVSQQRECGGHGGVPFRCSIRKPAAENRPDWQQLQLSLDSPWHSLRGRWGWGSPGQWLSPSGVLKPVSQSSWLLVSSHRQLWLEDSHQPGHRFLTSGWGSSQPTLSSLSPFTGGRPSWWSEVSLCLPSTLHGHLPVIFHA